MTTKTEQTIYTVTATFVDRQAAVDFRDMLEGLGLDITIQSKYAGPANISDTSETRLGMTILEEMAKNPTKTYVSDDFMMICEEHKYAASSWSPTVAGLHKERKIEKIARGMYRLPRVRPANAA